jgi:hypothetical protein
MTASYGQVGNPNGYPPGPSTVVCSRRVRAILSTCMVDHNCLFAYGDSFCFETHLLSLFREGDGTLVSICLKVHREI